MFMFKGVCVCLGVSECGCVQVCAFVVCVIAKTEADRETDKARQREGEEREQTEKEKLSTSE